MVAFSWSVLELEPHIVEVRKTGVLVEVLFRALHFVGFGAAAAAHQVGDAIDLGALVVMDMARNDDDSRVQGGRCLREKVAQGDLIGARVVVDVKARSGYPRRADGAG